MKTLKVRIEPNSAQRKVIDHMIDANRLVYNGMITACKRSFEKNGGLPSAFKLSTIGTRMRHSSPYIAATFAQSLNETAKRALRACTDTLGQHKRECVTLLFDTLQFIKSESHFPRYRPKTQYSSFTYPCPRYFSFVVEKKNGKKRRYLKLSKIPGTMRCYNQRTKIDGVAKTCTIKRKNLGSHYEYFATIVYETAPPVFVQPPKGSVGVDLGISNIATLSNGICFPNGYIFEKYRKQVQKIDRKLSKCLFASDEYRKYTDRKNHLNQKISDFRRNSVETISAYIANNYGPIAMEDLDVADLRRKSHDHYMYTYYNDASLGALKRRIIGKASSAGHEVILVDPMDTSQVCSSCHSMVKKDISIRVHSCPCCGLTLDRDVNASLNILERAGLMQTVWVDRPP